MRTALIVAGMIGAMSASAEAASLRIVSYNIHHAEGNDGRVDVPRIAAILRALEPDVVCLQEVDRNLPRTDRRDLPAELSAELGMAVVFDSNYDWEGGEYGNATLTSLPIVSWENHALPNPGDAEPRGCLRTTLRVGTMEIDVWNTHLGLKSDERIAQAEAIVAAVSDRPAILAGDLNDRPGSAPIAALTKLFQDVAGDGGEATYPAEKARARIDYILATAHFAAAAFRSVQTPETAIASDHLPIVAELTLPAEAGVPQSDRGIVDADDERIGEALNP